MPLLHWLLLSCHLGNISTAATQLLPASSSSSSSGSRVRWMCSPADKMKSVFSRHSPSEQKHLRRSKTCFTRIFPMHTYGRWCCDVGKIITNVDTRHSALPPTPTPTHTSLVTYTAIVYTWTFRVCGMACVSREQFEFHENIVCVRRSFVYFSTKKR